MGYWFREEAIDGGVADRGQPTPFASGRAWGVFSVEVPGDFDGELAWTLVANGQTVTIPIHIRPSYFIEPFKDASNNNEPPTIRFSQDGRSLSGPPVGISSRVEATLDKPVELEVWLSDVTPDTHVRESLRRRPPMSLRWHKLRGPGDVVLSEPTQEFDETSEQRVATTVTFAESGEYWLRAEALDATGEGGSGFQCCWTSATVQVAVSQ